MRKGLLIIISLFLCIVAAVPALAEDVKVNVNADSLKSSEIYVNDGVTMIGLEDYLRFAGADVAWKSPDAFTITENGKSLSMIVNQLTASLNNSELTAPKAPVKKDDQVLIPLRFVAEAFGFKVGWDDQQSLVSLSRKEVRDGLSPDDLLAKSSQACQKINTYSVQGAMDIDMKFSMGDKAETAVPQTVKTAVYGQIQNSPFKMYMKQIMKMNAKVPGLSDMTVETYISGSKMYMKMPGQNWTVLDIPAISNLLQQQQDIQSNPIKAVEQMKEMGVLCNYGNDTTVNGQDYYVVNATLDMKKFKEGYQKIMGDVMKGLPAEISKGQNIQGIVNELMKNMDIDYYCTIYINKKTLLSDIVKPDMKLKISMDPSKFPGVAGAGKDSPAQAFTMYEDARGTINIADPGRPFIKPDVSSATPAPQMTTSVEKK